MDALVYLAAAIAIIGLGTTVILFRNREPRGEDRGIKDFQRHMKALSPEARRSVIERVAPQQLDATSREDGS
jgi:hypothetical protein